MPDLASPEDLVVPDEAGQDRQARGVGRRPALGTPAVRVQVEERAGAGVPLAAVEEDVVELIQVAPIAIDDEQVAIAAAAPVDVPGLAALDPVRLGDRFVRNRIEGNALIRRMIDAVALVCVLELHRAQRHGAVDDRVRKAVHLRAARRDVAAEVGVHLVVGPMKLT